MAIIPVGIVETENWYLVAQAMDTSRGSVEQSFQYL